MRIILSAILLFAFSGLVSAQNILRTDITFESGRHTIHGELLLPQPADSIPMLIFLVGSGENSSHRTTYKNFVEQNLEALFLEEGYGILYFDKRGVGKSEGRWQRTNLYERADDAKAAIDYLKTIPGVDASRIGVVGHSQGAWVAQIVAARYPNDVKTMASIAGPVFGTRQSLTNIYNSGFICDGESEEKAFEKASKKARSDINWVTWFPVKKEWRQLREIADFDPSKELLNIKQEALFVFAENDHTVYPGWAISSLNETFFSGIPRNFTLQIVPGANHDLHMAEMCASEQDARKEPFSDYFQIVFKSWIIGHL